MDCCRGRRSGQLARTGASQGFPRAAAPVGVFSRGMGAPGTPRALGSPVAVPWHLGSLSSQNPSLFWAQVSQAPRDGDQPTIRTLGLTCANGWTSCTDSGSPSVQQPRQRGLVGDSWSPVPVPRQAESTPLRSAQADKGVESLQVSSDIFCWSFTTLEIFMEPAHGP